MLLLLFQIGESRFALDAKKVVEIVPQVNLSPVPRAPDYVAGLLNYRGKSVPVIDMCILNKKRACQARMTTRIIVAEYADAPGETPLIGLQAEQVTEIIKRDIDDFQAAGIRVCEAPYLGDLSHTPDGVVQLVKVKQLLSEQVREQLYRPEAA